MRILAVDPGIKNLGIALSDPTSTIANPLTILKHASRPANAAAILEIAKSHGVELIVIGQSLDQYGKPTFEGRRASRLAAELRSHSDIQVVLWDESFSTFEAQKASLALGSPRRKRQGHLDDLAATVILQSFLDAHKGDQ
jgi:putative Holliday junction resolvase